MVPFPPIWGNFYCNRKEQSPHPKWQGHRRSVLSHDRVWLPGSTHSWGPFKLLHHPQRSHLPSLYSFTQPIPLFFFFPLSCLELGFITYEKRTLFHLPEEDSFFSWVRIYSFFFKYHHTIYGKEGKPPGLVKEYVMKFKRHMHPSEKNIGA